MAETLRREAASIGRGAVSCGGESREGGSVGDFGFMAGG